MRAFGPAVFELGGEPPEVLVPGGELREAFLPVVAGGGAPAVFEVGGLAPGFGGRPPWVSGPGVFEPCAGAPGATLVPGLAVQGGGATGVFGVGGGPLG